MIEVGPRVLHVMECFVGGARRHLLDLLPELTRQGLEVHAALSARRDEHAERGLQLLRDEGVVVHTVAMEREVRPFADRRAFARLRAIVSEVRPDVVHTHGSKAGVLGRLAGRREGVRRLLHSPHGFAHEQANEFGRLRRGVFRTLERRLARRSERIVLLSPSEMERARAAGFPPAALVCIPNGVVLPARDELTPREEARRRLGLPQGAPVALYAGLMTRAKGPADLLAAHASTRGEWRIFLAGEGPERARLQAAAGANVTFLGYREDVPLWIDAADLVVVPSRFEGLPYIVLEALSRERAVLATRVGSCPDVVVEGRNGWLVDPEKTAALAERLEALAQKLGTVHAAGTRGRAGLGEDHRLATMVERHLSLYRASHARVERPA